MEETNYEGEDEDMLNGEEGQDEEDMDLNYDNVETDSELTSDDMDELPGEEEANQRGPMDLEGWQEYDEDDEDDANDHVEMLSADEDEVLEDGIEVDGDGAWQVRL